MAVLSSPMFGAVWVDRFLDLTKVVASWSKDPSTKCGAVIVRRDKTVLALGYNGLPRGIQDTPERLNDRSLKYPRVIHAEMNAILNATTDVHGAAMFITGLPCDRCAAHVAQAGIVQVFAWKPENAGQGDIADRWKAQMDIAKAILEEANVPLFLK